MNYLLFLFALLFMGTLLVFNSSFLGWLFLSGFLIFISYCIKEGIKKARIFLKIYESMPTVWQDISETIEIGQKSGCKIESCDFESVFDFYWYLESLEDFFELKIDENIIEDFERKYPMLSNLEDFEYIFLYEKPAAYYVEVLQEKCFEDFCAIKNSIKVRKIVGGKKSSLFKATIERRLKLVFA